MQPNRQSQLKSEWATLVLGGLTVLAVVFCVLAFFDEVTLVKRLFAGLFVGGLGLVTLFALSMWRSWRGVDARNAQLGDRVRQRTEEALRRQNQYLDALHETTLGVIGRLELNDLLQAITERAATLVGTAHGYFYIHEPESQEIEMNVGIGVFRQMLGSKAYPGVGVTGIALKTAEPLVVNDYQSWEGRVAKPGHAEIQSVVAIPIKSGAQVIGIFGLAHTERHRPFDDAHVAILTRFAQLAAVALENARLYNAAEQEIADRKRFEGQLRESKARLASVINNTEDLILSVDRDLNLTFFNETLKNLVEYTLGIQLVPGMNVRELAPPETLAQNREMIEHAFEGHPATYAMALKSADGECQLYIEVSLNPINGDDGQVVGLAVFAKDVTQRTLAEQQLRRQQELLQAVFDNIPVMIGVIDCQGQYTLVNQEWERTLGFDVDEMNMGDALAEMYPDPEQYTLAQQLLREAAPGWWDFPTVVRGGGVRDTSWTYTLLSDGTTLAFGQDITKRKEVDRLKNEFISTVSHELRTPLTSIRGSLGLIAGGAAGPIPERVAAMIDIAYKNSERLVRLINDILDIEKIESGKMPFRFKPIALEGVIEQAIQDNHAYGEQYHVSFQLVESLPGVKVNGDWDRLLQVMTNLLSNAAKFSPPHSQVEIKMERVPSGIRVAVSDHGPGIPEEFQSRIFQKFAQADASNSRQKGGTGLGLSIVKAIVEKHGGTVSFETNPNAGTTFYFDLPEWRPQPLAAPEPLAPVVPSAGVVRVLICEDDPDIAHLLGLMLKQGGFETDVAYDATQARQLLRAHPYAALTLDLLLPDQDGIKLIRELRAGEATRSLPIVVVSAQAEQERRQLNGDAMWVADWLQKPIDQRQLLRAVSHASRRSPESKPLILHVEDDPDVLAVVQAILEDTCDVIPAQSLAEAREWLGQTEFDLVILDPALPDGIGTDLLPFLRRGTHQVPVVLFSTREEDPQIVQQVNAALIKSQTTNEQLVSTITNLIKGCANCGDRNDNRV